MDRESFLFYQSYYQMALKLKDKKVRCDFYESIIESALHGKPLKDTGDPVVDMAFIAIRPLIEANIRNYKNGCKGGAPSESMKGNQNARKQTQNKPKSNRNQTQNKGNVNDNVNVKDNDKDNVKVNDNDNVNVNVNIKPAALPSENEEDFDIENWVVPEDFFDDVD